MKISFDNVRVFLKTGATDMRKSINTLSVIVSQSMKLNAFDKSVFVFCNKKKDTMAGMNPIFTSVYPNLLVGVA